MPSFIVIGKPATKGSTVSWLSDGGTVITKTDSAGLASWSQAVGWAARNAGIKRMPKPSGVVITAKVELPKPRSVRRALPTVPPDVDKVSRALLDALKGVAYEDDAQVTTLFITKKYAYDPITRVMVEPAPESL